MSLSPFPFFRELSNKQVSYHLFPVHAGDLRRFGEFWWPRVHRGHRFTRFNERCTGNASYSNTVRTVLQA